MSTEFYENLAPNRYFDRTFERDAVKILPGEYFATTRDMLIVTVLGSCVSACIHDPTTGIGGMNHFMLPGSPDHRTDNPSARYGVYAMELLLNHLLKLGAKKQRLVAKVFGGGNVLKSFTATPIGHRNADFVQAFLSTEKIPILSQDLLNEFPRKVYYFPGSGKVLVKKLSQLNNNTLIEREMEYMGRLKQAKVEGDVDLF